MSAETLLCDPVLRHGWDGIGRCTFAGAKVLLFSDICKYYDRKMTKIMIGGVECGAVAPCQERNPWERAMEGGDGRRS